MLRIYQSFRSCEGPREYSQADLITRITASLSHLCSYCDCTCKHYWYQLNIQDEQRNIVQSDLPRILCADCHQKGIVPFDILNKNYQEVRLIDEVCRLTANGSHKDWTFDENIKLLEAFEESHFDLPKVVSKFPQKTPLEIVKQFLLIPIRNFRGILGLTNQHFENIFKKEVVAKSNDDTNTTFVNQVLSLDVASQIDV